MSEAVISEANVKIREAEEALNLERSLVKTAEDRIRQIELRATEAGAQAAESANNLAYIKDAIRTLSNPLGLRSSRPCRSGSTPPNPSSPRSSSSTKISITQTGLSSPNCDGAPKYASARYRRAVVLPLAFSAIWKCTTGTTARTVSEPALHAERSPTASGAI